MSFSSLVKATALAAFATLAVAGPIHTAADSIVLQAEDAKLTGLTVSSKYNGYTGTSYPHPPPLSPSYPAHLYHNTL